MSDGHEIRDARPDESEALADLFVRLLESWGHEPGFCEACRDALELSSEFIESYPVTVIENDDRVLGFYSLVSAGTNSELRYHYVDPDAADTGLDEILLSHAMQTARSMGMLSMTVLTEPEIEPFYVASGARRVGEVHSVSPDRWRPILSLSLV